jgi:fructokinase
VAVRDKFTTVGLGELLWDVLPDGRQLGGAPANFAYMTSLLGDEGIVASRIGTDDLGAETKQRLVSMRLNTEWVQLDPAHPTGFGKVELDAQGQPNFAFADSVAWDFLEWTPAWQLLAQRADAVCFGSLAQRRPDSCRTIHSFLKAIRPDTVRVFDVNLRPPFYSAEVLSESARDAEIIKLNHDELPIVLRLLGFAFRDEESAARSLLEAFQVKLVCVTRGAKGSLLVTEQAKDEHPGIATVVGDTVGSGDAFTAALTYHYLRRAPLAIMNEAANRMGSWVAGQIGATPPRNEGILQAVKSGTKDQSGKQTPGNVNVRQ